MINKIKIENQTKQNKRTKNKPLDFSDETFVEEE